MSREDRDRLIQNNAIIAATLGEIGPRRRKIAENVKKIKEQTDEARSREMALAADARAHALLNEQLVREIQNPSLPRRFSDPAAHQTRNAFLKQAYTHSLDEIIQKEKDKLASPPTQGAIAKAHKLSGTVMRAYDEGFLSNPLPPSVTQNKKARVR